MHTGPSVQIGFCLAAHIPGSLRYPQNSLNSAASALLAKL
jgi:hypothetical protein